MWMGLVFWSEDIPYAGRALAGHLGDGVGRLGDAKGLQK